MAISRVKQSDAKDLRQTEAASPRHVEADSHDVEANKAANREIQSDCLIQLDNS